MINNKTSVLICDDSILVRKKIKSYLQTVGINIFYEASDGFAAVEQYKTYNPSIVIMDIIMPKKSGIEAVTDILKYDSKAKVIMASSVGSQSYLKDAINAGACEFLQKPIDNELLHKIILSVLKGE